MKYNILGFNQKKLVGLNLDIKDALILRWFVDFMPKMVTIIDKEKVYYWVQYKSVIDDLPCLEIGNRESIARKFDKFIDAKIMEKYLKKETGKGGGTYTCFRLTEKYLTLVGFNQTIETLQPQGELPTLDKKVDPPIDDLDAVDSKIDPGVDCKHDPVVDKKVDPKDNSINLNSSINLNKKTNKQLLDLNSENSESKKVVCVFDEEIILHEKVADLFEEIKLSETTIPLINNLYNKEGLIHIKALIKDAKDSSGNPDAYIYNMLIKEKDWYAVNQATYIKHLIETDDKHVQEEKLKQQYQSLVNEFSSKPIEKIEQLKNWFKDKAEKWVQHRLTNIPILVVSQGQQGFWQDSTVNNKNSYIDKILNENNYLLWSWLVLHNNYEVRYSNDGYFNKTIVKFVNELKNA